MAVSSVSRRQRAKALLGASAVAVVSWAYFANVWRGVVLSGAGDAEAVSLSQCYCCTKFICELGKHIVCMYVCWWWVFAWCGLHEVGSIHPASHQLTDSSELKYANKTPKKSADCTAAAIGSPVRETQRAVQQ